MGVGAAALGASRAADDPAEPLPEELVQLIIEYACDGLSAIAAVRTLRRDSSVPRDVWARCIVAAALPPSLGRKWSSRLGVKQNAFRRGALREALGDAAGDRERVAAALARHAAALRAAPSPGCKYQKYLRWLQDVPAASTNIRWILVLASTLPPLRDCFVVRASGATDRDGLEFSDALTASLVCLFNLSDGRARVPVFSARRFVDLLERVTADHAALRLLCAEYHQVECRVLGGVLTVSERF